MTRPSDEFNRWVDVSELAELLATTERGIYQRRTRGELPDDWSKIGQYVVWPRATIDQWMKNEGAAIRRANMLHRERRSR